MVTAEGVAIAIISAAIYSFVFYAKKKARDPGEGFNKFKFLATMIVGVVIGLGFHLSGMDFGQEAISTQLAMYAGTIALVESIIKMLWRMVRNKGFSSGG